MVICFSVSGSVNLHKEGTQPVEWNFVITPLGITGMIVLVDRDLGGSGTSCYHCSLWRIRRKRKCKFLSTSTIDDFICKWYVMAKGAIWSFVWMKKKILRKHQIISDLTFLKSRLNGWLFIIPIYWGIFLIIKQTVQTKSSSSQATLRISLWWIHQCFGYPSFSPLMGHEREKEKILQRYTQ